eukprot:14583292-Alexandrium_andersonii.AAC.1
MFSLALARALARAFGAPGTLGVFARSELLELPERPRHSEPPGLTELSPEPSELQSLFKTRSNWNAQHRGARSTGPSEHPEPQ